ncbi:putative transcription factor C3H family [Helianthus debilis subsp. tardiflorus]
MCQKFLDGICRNGDDCTFAHGPNDLREPPPNWQELVKDNRGGNAGVNWNWNDDQMPFMQPKLFTQYLHRDDLVAFYAIIAMLRHLFVKLTEK